MRIRAYIAILTCLTLTYAVAAPPSIGAASARGSIRIDGSRVNGNGTLFDGSVVETEKATTTLRLDKGVEVKLATDSRGKLYRDRLILEKGASEVAGLNAFRLETGKLSVSAADAASRGVVRMKDANTVEIAALTGSFAVSSNGILLANVRPGAGLAFNMQQAGATAPTEITGTLSKKDGAYFVTVAETGVVYEVTGSGLDKYVGKKVKVTGTPDPSKKGKDKAAAVIVVSGVSAAGAAAAGGGAAAAAGMAAGTKLIIAGVVVAAATGTAVGVYESQKDDTPASR